MPDYYDLGTYSRTVTTGSSDAQRWFDRGLAWTYGFNHEEAIACYRRALAADSACAMAWWGIAYASGPNYNKPWEAFDEDDANQSLQTAYDALDRAEKQSGPATPIERALIGALRSRYPSAVPAADMCPWNDDYAEAMRAVHAEHGTDPDVAALFAEAIMNRTPWALWDLKSGAIAEGAGTAEAIEVLEEAMRRRRDRGEEPHAGLLHMYIHAMEMSPHPERALTACDELRDLVPDAGHLRHMPTHIDVLCGDYRAVVESNHAAIEADRKFLAREGAGNFYSLYRCHDYHFKIYGAMFLGQFRPAIAAAEEMITTLPEELLTVESPPMADWLEGFVPMKQHVLVRFGRWREIVEQSLPENRDLFCVTTAMMRYAMSVAHGALGEVDEAAREAERFDEALKSVLDSRYVFNNTCIDILAIAREMMLGRARVPARGPRHRLRASEPVGGPRRQPALRRAMGMDAADPPRARRPPPGAGAGRGGLGGIPCGSGLRRFSQPCLSAPRERLEPARIPRVPGTPRTPRRSGHSSARSSGSPRRGRTCR